MTFSSWTGKHLVGGLFPLLGLLTFIGNMPACYERFRVACDTARSWEGRPFNTGIQLLDERRLCIRENLPIGETLYLYAPAAKGLPSTLRSLHLGLTWETLPQNVIISDTNGLGTARYITTSLYEGDCPVASRDCRCIGTKGNSAALWSHRDDVSGPSAEKPPPPSWWREGSGVMTLLVFIVLCSCMGGWLGLGTGLLFFSVGMVVPTLVGFSPGIQYVFAMYVANLLGVYWLFRNSRWRLTRLDSCVHGSLALAAGLMLFVVYSILTLTHTFVAPNGLGVYGGKAKLLYLAGGFPTDFFIASAWATLQPAYPPGFALVTLGCYGVAGGCGEWLTQLLPCLFMSLSAGYLVQQVTALQNAQGRRLFILGYMLLCLVGLFLGASSLWMTTLYYAEPLMLLFFLIGADAVLRSRYPVLGWVIVGACGWIKTEGVVLFLALWLALRLIDGHNKASFPHLLLGLVLPLAWFFYSRGQGATLYDYAPLWSPDPDRMGKAAFALLKLGFIEPWRYGFAYPLACLIPFVRLIRRQEMQVASLMMLLCSCAFIWILGTSRAPDMDWHLQSLERLLFIPAIFFFQLQACQSRGECGIV